MEQEIIIHIGYHKTASSYLQSVLKQQANVNFIFLAGKNREILDHVERKQGFKKEILVNWVKEQIKFPNEPIFLSHEELSGHSLGWDIIDPVMVARNLKAAFPSAKILIVLRKQEDYIISSYTSRVVNKGRETRSFKDFMMQDGILDMYNKLLFDQLISIYEEFFGKENLHIIPFELLKVDKHSFFQAICKILKRKVPFNAYQTTINRSSKNVGVINIFRKMNFCFEIIYKILRPLLGKREMNLRYKYYNFKRRLLPFVEGLVKSKNKILIDDFLWENLKFDVRRYSKSNQIVAEKYNLDLKSLGYL